MESYDFLRQYELDSGSRVCFSTLSSLSGCSPVDATNLPHPRRFRGRCSCVTLFGFVALRGGGLDAAGTDNIADGDD